jgi:hypothetical protein
MKYGFCAPQQLSHSSAHPRLHPGCGPPIAANSLSARKGEMLHFFGCRSSPESGELLLRKRPAKMFHVKVSIP